MDERDTGIERYWHCLRHLLLPWQSFAVSTFEVEQDRVAASQLAIPWAAQVHRDPALVQLAGPCPGLGDRRLRM